MSARWWTIWKGGVHLPDLVQRYPMERTRGLMDNNLSKNIVTLDGSLNALKLRFNNHKKKIRFLALLSPTCPLWRDQGARAVRETIITKFPDADIAASIVWIPILDNDSIEAALPSVKYLSNNRFQHFYDQNQIVGKEIAKSIGWDGHVAWDIYLFYAPYAAWNNGPPEPKSWMHQLKDGWADQAHFRTGDGLVNALFNAITTLSAGGWIHKKVPEVQSLNSLKISIDCKFFIQFEELPFMGTKSFQSSFDPPLF